MNYPHLSCCLSPCLSSSSARGSWHRTITTSNRNSSSSSRSNSSHRKLLLGVLAVALVFGRPYDRQHWHHWQQQRETV